MALPKNSTSHREETFFFVDKFYQLASNHKLNSYQNQQTMEYYGHDLPSVCVHLEMSLGSVRVENI